MTQKDKLLSTLGLCRKAGFLIAGFDPVAQAVREKRIDLILLAGDLSPKSAKEISFLAGKHDTAVLSAPVSMDEIKSRTGKRAGILGIENPGLAETLRATISRVNANEEDWIV